MPDKENTKDIPPRQEIKSEDGDILIVDTDVSEDVVLTGRTRQGKERTSNVASSRAVRSS